jgi:uncharacterized protein DUF2637
MGTMSARHALAALLAVVATAAAVLSFAALRDLAELCGFSTWLAWLLPVVVDAGAAAGSLVWLGGRAPDRARRFARGLALVLLGSSVAANALSHGLAAYGMRPAWWVVVLVSGVAPAVLGAVVHLAVLCGRAADRVNQENIPWGEPTLRTYEQAGTPADTTAVLPVSPTEEDAGPPADTSDASPAVGLHSVPSPTPPGEAGDEPGDPVAELIAAGAGRRRLARELDITEHEARQLLDARRNGSGS